jgi:7-cyano-7-deazaguanine synthase
MNQAIRLGSWAGRKGKGPKVLAPIARLSKKATLLLGRRLGVDFSKTWTCYDPKAGGEAPCGRCDACRVRRKGFEEAGMNA